MKEDIKEVLITNEEISKRSKEVGTQITKDFSGKFPLVIGVLKGSLPFMMELIKHIDLHVELDFMVVSSYGHSTTTTGEVKIIKDLDTSIENRDVIIVEDIIDTGVTLNYLISLLKHRNAKSVTIVTMLNKKSRRQIDLQPNYCCFEIPNVFVVGFGLDFYERFRNLPYVGILKNELYQDLD